MGSATSTEASRPSMVSRSELTGKFRQDLIRNDRLRVFLKVDKDKHFITEQEFAEYLNLLSDANPMIIQLLYHATSILGGFPFLEKSGTLLRPELWIACQIHCGNHGLFDLQTYAKLVFQSFALADSNDENEHPEKEKDSGKELSTSETTATVSPVESEERVYKLPENARWEGYLEKMENLTMKASDLLLLITLFLIVSANEELDMLTPELWKIYEQYAMLLIRYVDVQIQPKNIKSMIITQDQFVSLQHFFGLVLKKLFSPLILRVQAKADSDIDISDYTILSALTEETTLVNGPSFAYMSNALSGVIDINYDNMIKLYCGAEFGFSIRSLEMKIFKWRAPTIFIVEGKRISEKTQKTNRRYGDFVEHFPYKLPMKEWQKSGETVRYAVVVRSPWTISNKNNFGDTSTTIVSLAPRFDVYRAKRAANVYFNTLGMGIGFGNDQPVIRNTVRKYIPGDVSLTLDSTLEFGVFRHLAGSNSYFETSLSLHEDFEDRFIITDVEVWGVGTSKELQEQKRQWEWEKKVAEQRQSVNVRTMGEDRAFLEMAGIIGNHGNGGSV